MVLRTAPVDTPPAGVDWLYTVPGQFLENVTGITATLTTPGGPWYPFADSSGNGYDGLINVSLPGTPALVFGRPGLVPGNPSTRFGVTSTPAEYAYGHVVGPINFDLGQSFTIEFLALAEPFPQDSLICYFESGGFQAFVEIFADGHFEMARIGDFLAYTCSGPFPFDGNPHLVDVVLPFAGNFAIYVDGALTPLVSQMPPGGRAVGPPNGYDFFIGAGGPPIYETIDEFALFPFALTAGQVAARQAARGSFAAYEASVLGDGPCAYYHLDEAAGGARQVTLAITDGANEVVEIPSGFPEVASAGPFAYSWQPGLNSSTQTPNGETTTVAIPHLILPAGYTIGAQTLDLKPADQWSNVVVWWDDNIMNALDPINPYAYPPGELLVPRFLRSGP